MEQIKLKVLDKRGVTLLTSTAAEQQSLVYRAAYNLGDRVSLEIGTPGQYIVCQFEDTMPRYHIVKDIGIIQSILPIKR